MGARYCELLLWSLESFLGRGTSSYIKDSGNTASLDFQLGHLMAKGNGG